MIHAEKEYVIPALEAVEPWLHLLPTDIQRKLKLAHSILKTHGSATVEELRRELGGSNWVIARRTRRIIERYGKDVICVSHRQYNEAERRAIEKRFAQ